MGDRVQEILSLVGNVVLVPCRPLTKIAIPKAWQTFAISKMQDPAYIRSFAGKNIGVVLGQASGGLCSIDIDADGDVEPFLADNPLLRETTRTRRARGCNVWVVIDGDYPRLTPITVVEGQGERKWGEWRAGGAYTVICGSAIDRKKGETEPVEYRFLNRARPIRIRFEEIAFPSGFKTGNIHPFRLRPASVSCEPASLHPYISASLHNTADQVLGNIAARKQALESLTTNFPGLLKLYQRVVEPRFQARRGARNAFVVQAVTFLYRAVAPKLVLVLVGVFYDCNRSMFHDSRDQHMNEAKAQLEGVSRTYYAELAESECKVYDALQPDEQAAFRICRDLALLQHQERPPLTFFLSFSELGARLGVFPMQAQRIMLRLESYGLIGLSQKGTRRAPGVQAKAGEYRWLLR
jgi:hypothetical protein